MKFSDIPQFTSDGRYRVDVGWRSLESWIKRQQEEQDLDISPDFQRGHVWTEEQQKNYVVFCLRGGVGSSELRFNCVGWMGNFEGPFVLVDGKQRLTAVLKFLNNELEVFDCTYDQFEGRLSYSACSFSVRINDLPTKADVLRWYLEINSGGVVHTEEELNKVRKMLKNE